MRSLIREEQDWLQKAALERIWAVMVARRIRRKEGEAAVVTAPSIEALIALGRACASRSRGCIRLQAGSDSMIETAAADVTPAALSGHRLGTCDDGPLLGSDAVPLKVMAEFVREVRRGVGSAAPAH